MVTMNENKPHLVIGDLYDEGRADLAGDGASVETIIRVGKNRRFGDAIRE